MSTDLQKLKYHIVDLETENHEYFGRFASPWHPDNFIVAYGWKDKGDTECRYEYLSHKDLQSTEYKIPDDCDVIVGHNLRFDLTWLWKHPSFKPFIERGGKVWCTQYAEYLLEGHDEDFHMNKLENVAVLYGGTKKVDAVKAMWDDGKLTSQIPKDLLIDYLVGTKEELRNGGDIGNTEKIYLGQIERAKELGMVNIIEARMDGYLATTEMEYNGINVDMSVAMQEYANERVKLNKVFSLLNELAPTNNVPAGCEFNWGSTTQVSAILFGGAIKYEWSDHYVDDATGELARSQVDVPHWYLTDGDFLRVDKDPDALDERIVRYQSGKRKGEAKSKKIKLPEGKLKKKVFRQIVQFPRQVAPKPEWRSSRVDAKGFPLYSTSSEVLEELMNADNAVAKAYTEWRGLTKNIDTYYIKVTQSKTKDGETKVNQSGMLSHVKPDGIINHYLNHTSTVTSRMSASKPNCQNIPRGDTSRVKTMFRSRFPNGVMIEADYSQLEVVIKGALSRDPNLLRDLRAGVDFHCKRVGLKNGISYEEAYDLCKVQEIPKWSSERTKCKIFTFQREYGAGVATLAATTGMTEDEVNTLIKAEEKEYPLSSNFWEKVKESVLMTVEDLRIDFQHGGHKMIKRGYWTAPSGTRYAFRSEDSPEWMTKNGGDSQTFKPTKLKNYPVQGSGGEVMQVQLGVLFRACVKRGFWSLNPEARALLCNTVHDCAWGDCQEDTHEEFGALIRKHLEDVPNTFKHKFNVDYPVKFPVDVEYGRDMMDMSHHLNK